MSERLVATKRTIQNAGVDEDALFIGPAPRVTLPGSIRDVFDLWIEADLDENWRVAFALVPYGGQPVVSELRIFPRDEWTRRRPGQSRYDRVGVDARTLDGRTVEKDHYEGRFASIRHGISAPMLRKVPFNSVRRLAGKFKQEIEQAITKHGGVAGAANAFEDPDAQAAAFSFANVAGRRSVGRAKSNQSGWPDRTYAEIARAYVQSIDVGSVKPVADVARRRRLTQPQVRDAIRTARERGLLTGAVKRGRPGGELTPKAIEILRGSQK